MAIVIETKPHLVEIVIRGKSVMVEDPKKVLYLFWNGQSHSQLKSIPLM